MRIAHISDTHGTFLKIPKFTELVVHSGDIFPNANFFSTKQAESDFQKFWISNNVENIKSWLEGRPLLYILGNHDYIEPEFFEEVLNKNKIEAYCIQEKYFLYNNISFYGFPWVPYINGMFTHELNNKPMKIKCDELVNILDSKNIEILVCHGPMTRGLSAEGIADYGNQHLENALLSAKNTPEVMLVGHCHLAKGIKYRNDIKTLVINSATTIHSFEY